MDVAARTAVVSLLFLLGSWPTLYSWFKWSQVRFAFKGAGSSQGGFIILALVRFVAYTLP